MNPRDFTFYTRDILYNLIEPLDNWLSFTIVKRFNGVGTWNLELPVGSVAERLVDKKTGVIVKYKGVTIFSGGYTTDYQKTKTSVAISGRDDNALLETPTRPTPSQVVGPYPDEYDVTTGIASTVMRSLVDRNIGPSSPLSGWKTSQLLLATDPLLGSTITARARFDPLVTLLAQLASTPTATGLGFQILQSDAVQSRIVFSVYEPRDLHETTVFSTDLGTAEDFTYTYALPEANYFIVGGGDQYGQDRTVVEGGDSDAITAAGRIVAKFVDRRGVTDTSELQQELAELIAGAVTSEKVEIIPVDNNALEFLDDYNLGDYVTAVVDGVEYPRIIRELEIDFDPVRGPIIKPLLADPYGTNDSITSRQFMAMESRVLNLEQVYQVPEDSITERMLHPFQKNRVGDIKMTARDSAQLGWLFCNGSLLSTTVYPELFAQIAYKFGGSGSTFKLPDMRNRFPIGAGTLNALGLGVDVTTIALDHTHNHSHGLNNHTHTGAAHTHPGSHSHPANSSGGNLALSHGHTVNIDHSHGTILSGFAQYSTDLTAVNPPAGGTTVGHKHNVNIAALGSTPVGTISQINTAVTGSTGSDSNAPAANYGANVSGVPSPNTTEADASHPDSLSTTYTNPSRTAVNFEIYVGRV